MRLHYLLLVMVAVLIISIAEHTKATTVMSSDTTVMELASNAKGRLLRVVSTTDEDDESEGDGDDLNILEERGVPDLSSLKNSVSKATSKLTSKISAAMTTDVKLWAKEGKSVDDLKKILGMEKLDDAALTQAQNYKVYDKLVTAQIPSWSKKDLSPEQVRVILGIDKLSDYGLSASPNFKYYEHFVENQIPIWVKTDISPNDVWLKLRLNELGGDPSVFKDNPNYGYYLNFITNELESWAMKMFSKEDVMAKMGLKSMHGNAKNVNRMWYKYYVESADSFRVNGWYKQQLSSYDVWTKLGLGAIRPAEREGSTQYTMYRSYAKKLDGKVDEAMSSRSSVSNAIGKDATPAEISTRIKIWVDSGRSDAFVKHALGLTTLKGTKITSANNYQYFKDFVKDRGHSEERS